MVRRTREGTRELAMLRWGLVPPWSAGPDSSYSMINAPPETVATKPAFRNFEQRIETLDQTRKQNPLSVELLVNTVKV